MIFIFQQLPTGEALPPPEATPAAPREVTAQPEFSELAKASDTAGIAMAAQTEAQKIVAAGLSKFQPT